MVHDIFSTTSPMSLATTLSLYESLRPQMPMAQPCKTVFADRLRDILSEFDAVLLDGYGVLNVGSGPVDGAGDMLAMAHQLGVETLVLTNGASRPASFTAAKYHGFGFDLDRQHIVSSRDALLAYLDQHQAAIKTLGVVDSFTQGVAPRGMVVQALSPDQPAAWHEVDTIGFFGAVHWDDTWQDCLSAAMSAGQKVLVANPDVAAPHEGGFSREPGFWVSAAAQQHNAFDHVQWFGKPHGPVFDLALERLEAVTGRSNWNRDRIAMVGDSLHTDILGGQAKGLKTVLITGHGLFRDGGSDDAMAESGIYPDFITATV